MLRSRAIWNLDGEKQLVYCFVRSGRLLGGIGIGIGVSIHTEDAMMRYDKEKTHWQVGIRGL